VIHGRGTYGGVSCFGKDHGLLECMIGNNEPIGYLTAEDVIEMVKEKQQ
jgi:hypothetical protein